MHIDSSERQCSGAVAGEAAIFGPAQNEAINKVSLSFLEYLLYLHKAGSIKLSANDLYEIECELNPEL